MTDDPEEIPMAVLDGLLQHGSPVRAAREAAGLSVIDLADRSELGIERIKAFKRGGATPSEAEASRLAAATGVPADIFAE